MTRARQRLCKVIFSGLAALWTGVLPAVDVQVQGIVIALPDPIRPFIATEASPVVVPAGSSLRLIIRSAVEGKMAATIDVAPMPPDLSLAAFWPEYLKGIQEEARDAAIEEAIWKRGILQGKTAMAVAKDQGGDAFTTKIYMLSSKGNDAFFSVEVQIAKGQDAKDIEKQIDLALAKVRLVKKGAP